MSEWIEGVVQRALWSNPESGYAILNVRSSEKSLTVVGGLAGLIPDGEGEEVFASFEGAFEDHPVHGWQFRASGYLVGSPRTLMGLKSYLSSRGMRGVGKKLATAIVDHFGMDTLRVIDESPSRLTEVSGIGSARAKAISEQWQADAGQRSLSVLLRGLGLRSSLISRIRERYREQTAHVVTTRPYLLAREIRGVGFRTADAIASRQGMPPHHPARIQAAVLHVLEHLGDEGHCFVPRNELYGRVEALDVPSGGVDSALGELETDGCVMVESVNESDDRVYAMSVFSSEEAVATDVCELLGQVHEVRADDVSRAAHCAGTALDSDQLAAVRTAMEGGLSIITGGPGTGKTTLVRALIRAVAERGEHWKLASPTGRAARRLSEATGVEASTVHRLLEMRPGEGFQRCASNPLACDGIVIDEASMIDLMLMRALLEALPRDRPRFSLVLVGDVDQLPSVGAGQVLRDLIASGETRVVRLHRIYRQGEGSGIIRAATDVLAGTVPASGERVGNRDCFFLRRDDADIARQTVLSVVAERLPANGFSPVDDVQVLCPTRKGPLGTETLNKELQQRLNPEGAPIRRGDREFRQGDRVLCTRNRYDFEVFNGDVGRVVSVGTDEMIVDFEGRRIAWPLSDLRDVDLAYAMTVHKSQGSEYPAVVLALHHCHSIMLRRNLFYTALTRASRFFCAVGSPKGWARAVHQSHGLNRWTRLSDRIRERARDPNGVGLFTEWTGSDW